MAGVLFLKKLLFNIIFLVVICVLRFTEGFEYCQNKSLTCISGERHFSCIGNMVPKGKFHSFCPNSYLMRDYFLRAHNQIRNKVAQGDLKGNGTDFFPEASRMREFIWDRELEYVAHLHASYCRPIKSKCHLTSKFHYAGQILSVTESSEPINVFTLLNGSFTDMFNEGLEVSDPISFVHKFSPERYENHVNFAQIVNDRAHRLGCVLALCTDCPEKYCYYLTCQYDTAPLIEKFLYETGLPASTCSDWDSKPSKKYKNLCRNTGKIWPLERNVCRLGRCKCFTWKCLEREVGKHFAFNTAFSKYTQQCTICTTPFYFN